MSKDLSIYNPPQPIPASYGFESYNNVQRMFDLIPEQFKEKPHFEAFIETFASGIQELEDVITDILLNTELETATGETLDVWGRLFGVGRLGNTDEVYRRQITNKIIVLTSDGTPNEIIGLVGALTGATDIQFFEHYPASYLVQAELSDIGSGLPTAFENTPPESGLYLKAASPAGVGYAILALRLQGQAVLSEQGFDVDLFEVSSGGTFYELITDGGENLVVQSESASSEFAALGVLSETIPVDGQLVTAGGTDLWYTTASLDQLMFTYFNEKSVQTSGIFAEVLMDG